MAAGAQREAGEPVLNVQKEEEVREEAPVAGVRELAISTHVMMDDVAPVVPGIAVDVDVGEEKGAVAPVTALAAASEQVVSAPMEVGIDYDKLVDRLGCQRVDPALVHRIAHLTLRPPHRFLRRGIFFAHRDLDKILDLYEAAEKFYLYTGRRPSSEALRLGDLIPFMFAKYLQDAFKVPIVIQLKDDETFFSENLTIPECKRLARENAKDIIACGFDIGRTFIFTDFNYVGGAFHENMLEVSKLVPVKDLEGITGNTPEGNIGMVTFPPVLAAAPSIALSFPHLFPGNDQLPCLIPCGIDQDPYFRMARDVAPEISFQKPSLIESKIFPALQGESTKMSTSVLNSAIYVTDSSKQIKAKVNRYAFSGGQDSVKLHMELGADLDVDVPIKYLHFFLEDDDELEHIKKEYKEGRMLTGEVKQRLIAVLSDLVVTHQRARAQVTEEMVDAFMAVRQLPSMFG